MLTEFVLDSHIYSHAPFRNVVGSMASDVENGGQIHTVWPLEKLGKG